MIIKTHLSDYLESCCFLPFHIKSCEVGLDLLLQQAPPTGRSLDQQAGLQKPTERLFYFIYLLYFLFLNKGGGGFLVGFRQMHDVTVEGSKTLVVIPEVRLITWCSTCCRELIKVSGSRCVRAVRFCGSEAELQVSSSSLCWVVGEKPELWGQMGSFSLELLGELQRFLHGEHENQEEVLINSNLFWIIDTHTQ